MKELLVLLATNLVDNRDAVSVTEEEQNGITTLRLKVSPDDMGKVIGKQGRIARAIRTLVKAAAINEEKKVNVEIV
ncbi:MAG: KH domain-containing protein [Defluviitaleaceae bacterium]|nr:KH domain-containing protein [Defluviitaleaceae bacterium]